MGTSFTHVTISGNDHHFASDHYIGSTFDAVRQRLPATVQVIEFRFGDRVVDVHCRDFQSFFLNHLVEMMHSCRSLLGNALDARDQFRMFFMDISGEITSIIEDHVGSLFK